MKERKDLFQSLYLKPEIQLLLASKVNRLCDAEKEDFDEDLIQDATEIVRLLDSKIKFTSNYQLTANKRSPGDEIVGATEYGTQQMSTGEKNKHYHLLGADQYRIGAYVATKIKTGRDFGLSFEPFFGAGYASLILNKPEPRTTINYKKDSLEVVKITKDIPQIIKIMFFSIAIYKPTTLWSSKESSR